MTHDIIGTTGEQGPPKETFDLGNGYVLKNVHPEALCQGRECVIHAPTEHHMRDWSLHWREDRAIFERICPSHGTGHPDPDQMSFWRETNQEWQSVHGCCGCCREPEGGALVPAGQGVDGPSKGGAAVLSLA